MTLDGDALDEALLPEPEVFTQYFLGRRHIVWERSPLPLLAARALRRRLRAALKYLDSLLAEVEDDDDDDDEDREAA